MNNANIPIFKPNWSHIPLVTAFTIADNTKEYITNINLPAKPLFLQQTHSNNVIHANEYHKNIIADAIIGNNQQICTVITADCLPILVTDNAGTIVAAIHAGWRGLFSGIISNTIRKMHVAGNNLAAWIGPGISQHNYIVGAELKNQFTSLAPEYARFFIKSQQHYLMDLTGIAIYQLNMLQISNISCADVCTYATITLPSYRRNKTTSRMMSCIYIS